MSSTRPMRAPPSRISLPGSRFAPLETRNFSCRRRHERQAVVRVVGEEDRDHGDERGHGPDEDRVRHDGSCARRLKCPRSRALGCAARRFARVGSARMTTVRDAVFEMLRERGMTTMFGNPGSTELPMLADFPDDFRYVLGLQEAVVVGHGRRLRAGDRPPGARQPPHRARRRQRDGRDLQRAGQQVAARRHRRPAGPLADDAAGEPDQPRRDADAASARQVELRAAARRRTSRTRSRAPRTSRRCRRGARPSSRSRWTTGTPRSTTTRSRTRRRARSSGRAQRRPDAIAAWPSRLRAGIEPGAGRGPGPRRRAAAGRRRSRWPRSQRLPVWATPAPGGGRLGFPEDHPRFAGILPPAIGPLGETLARARPRARRRLVGLPVLPEHPRPAAARGHHARRDHERPDEAARAPMGDAIVADPALTLRALRRGGGRASDRVGARARGRRPRRSS